MNKEQNAKRYLDIPAEKTLVYTFKFNTELPPPIPQPKTMFLPLDPERYIKPKLTLFHVKRKANLMTDINLGIPIDEMNMKPELYNPPPDAKFELSAKDRELLEEKPPKDVKKKKSPPKTQPTNGKAQPAGTKQKEAAKPQQSSVKPKPGEVKKPEPSQTPKKKEEPKKPSIDEYVKKSFEIAKTYAAGSKHPNKDGLQCQEVFEIIPDFRNIATEFYTVKTEVSTETLKHKETLLKFETDLDKKPILAVYVHKPLFENLHENKKKDNEDAMEEEGQEKDEENKESESELAKDPLLKVKKVENFEHIGNYVYSQPKPTGGVIKRDLLLNLNKKTHEAHIYAPQTVILKKKKVLFMAKTVYKDEDMEDEKKKKKTVKLIKRDLDKDELLLKKKKYKELQLENTPFYKETEQQIENYQEEDADELELIKKKFVKEEEEEEAEEEQNEGEEEQEKEEEEQEYNNEEENEDKDKDKENDEELFGGSEKEEEKGEANEKMEEENQEIKEEPAEAEEEVKEEKANDAASDKDAAQELAEFFENSEDEDDDDDD